MSVTTSVGETESETIPNSIGKGSFVAALVSSLNIGCAVKEQRTHNKNLVLKPKLTYLTRQYLEDE